MTNTTHTSAAHKDQQHNLSYVDQLIHDRGFVGLTPEIKDELRNQLYQRLDDFMAAKVISTLSDDDLAAFEQMLKDKKSDEELQKFTKEHIADYDNFLTSALLEFRAVYLGIIEP